MFLLFLMKVARDHANSQSREIRGTAPVLSNCPLEVPILL